MSRKQIQLLAEHHARAVCAEVLHQLRLEIAAGPMRVIHALEQAATCIVEHTGGNHVTAALRTELAECQRLRAVRELSMSKRRDLRHIRLVSKGGDC